MIRIPQEKVSQLIANVYAMSVPVGMGHLHFRSGELDRDTHIALQTHFANRLAQVKESPRPSEWPYPDTLLSMDYIHGRQCKFSISYYRGELVINDDWYDHSEAQFTELLARCGIDANDKVLSE
jgi:hypothetical protein